MTLHDTRPLPALTDANRPFWTGGEHGLLQFPHCRRCGWLLHPPAPICPECLGRSLDIRAVSGKGTVVTFTINHQAWRSTLAVPYAVAIVELDERPGLRLTTNLVGCALDQIAIGMRVRVRFEHLDDVWIPLFEPDVPTPA